MSSRPKARYAPHSAIASTPRPGDVDLSREAERRVRWPAPRRLAVDVGDDHPRALGDELADDAGAETRGAAGDDGGLPFKPHDVALPSLC